MSELLQELDYDPGLLNDYGGGNVQWWHDYIRSEINACNEYWRSRIEAEEQPTPNTEPPECNRTTNAPCKWSGTPVTSDTCVKCGITFPEWG